MGRIDTLDLTPNQSKALQVSGARRLSHPDFETLSHRAASLCEGQERVEIRHIATGRTFILCPLPVKARELGWQAFEGGKVVPLTRTRTAKDCAAACALAASLCAT